MAARDVMRTPADVLFASTNADFEIPAPDARRAIPFVPARKPTLEEQHVFDVLRTEPIEIHFAFFCRDNVELLQRLLYARVFQRCGYWIDRQSDEHLVAAMMRVFEEKCRYSRFDVAEQVSELNEILLSQLVPMVVANIGSQVRYLRDMARLPVPLERGLATSTIGTNRSLARRPGI
jgi:hypothetical protein